MKTHETSMTTQRLTCGFPAFVACFLLAVHVTADAHVVTPLHGNGIPPVGQT